MSDARAAVAIMAYYPAAARAARVGGAAILECWRNEHVRLSDCTVISEAPAGYGFGEAALTLSKQAKDNPKVSMTALSGMARIKITFSLNPPYIFPNLLLPAHVFTNPDWMEKPAGDAIQRVYPIRAERRGVGGMAVLDCTVGSDGGLSACKAIDEAPIGYGFGDAVLKLVPLFKLRPKMLDGEPVPGGRIHIPVYFSFSGR